MSAAPEGPPLSTDDGDKLKKAEFEQRMEEARIAQNLPEGAVPEQRPQAFQTVDDPHSLVYKNLVEEGDPRGGVPAMDKSAYDRAGSKAQMDKAARESLTRTRLYPGARAYLEDGGLRRAVAVNRVVSWKSFEDQVRGTSGVPTQHDQAEVAEYEVVTRDGRSEVLIVDADRLETPAEQADWGRTAIS
jgi:hypothetical protein